jgi:hypothetical protein
MQMRPTPLHRLLRRLQSISTVDNPPQATALDDEFADDTLGLPSDSVTISDLQTKRIFVLLGELGVGKTWLFQHETLRLQTEQSSPYTRFVELGDYADNIELNEDVFDHAGLTAALADHRPAYVFLDALDQGLVQMPRLDRFLLRKARSLHTTSLHMRISSRVSLPAWSLAESLAELYSTGLPDVTFTVGPLTTADIRNEAISCGVDGDRFLDELRRRKALGLASHPLNLALLLRLYRPTGRLMTDRTELYRQASRRSVKSMTYIRSQPPRYRAHEPI